jgi:hypothetical protein
MVVLWVNGKAVATLTEAEVLPLLRCTERVQLRDENGRGRGTWEPFVDAVEPSHILINSSAE